MSACRHSVRFVGGRYPKQSMSTKKGSSRLHPQSTPPCCKPHIIHSQHIVFPQHHGGPQSGAIAISSTGHIDSIHPSLSLSEAKQLSTKLNRPLTSLGDNIALSPGLIDVHCHISELGRNWEGYHTATRAAAAGGITTLMGMPLNSLPSTTTVDALQQEIDASCNAKMMSDVGLWGGAVPSYTSCKEGINELKQLLDAGVFGLKAFLAPLPADAGFETVTPKQLGIAADICGSSGKPVLVHSELMTQQQQDEMKEEAYQGKDVGSYAAHVNSRPDKWERDAVEVVCHLTDRCHMHVVHLSYAGCLDVIESTKRHCYSAANKGSDTSGNLTVETCPHYLLFDLESLPDCDTRYKCFPPIREKANLLDLWERGLLGNQQNNFPLIDMIASDHSPCTPDMRMLDSGNVRDAWGGLSGLQYQLPSTVAALVRYIQQYSNGNDVSNKMLTQLAQWWSTAPSHLVPGLSSFKGIVDVGYQADLCAWDMTHNGKPNDYSLERHRWKDGSVYADMSLSGRVVGTWLRGVQVYDGELDALLEKDHVTDGIGSLMLCSNR